MDGLKQRVIGAVVLVSLAVIFVPMLFDEPHTERSARVIDIPEQPPFPEVETPPVFAEEAPSYRLEEPAPGVTAEQPRPDAELPAARQNPVATPAPTFSATDSQSEPQPEPFDSPATTSPAPTQPQPEAGSESAQETESAEFTRSLEGAWVVQLGSFGNADNARRLRDNVRAKGYDSHIQRIERGDTTFTRVFSGPYAEKSDAEKAKKTLDAEFGVNGLVTSGDR